MALVGSISGSTGTTQVAGDISVNGGDVTTNADTLTLSSNGNVIAKLDLNNNGGGHKFEVQDFNGISKFFVTEDAGAELSGSLVISGSTSLGATVERMTHFQTTGSTIAFDTTFNSIFYVNNPNADITANFTNVPTANNRIVTPTVILSQSGTARNITAVQVNSVGVTPINWANGVTPTPTINKQNVFGFSLIRSGSIWTVLGQMSTYG